MLKLQDVLERNIMLKLQDVLESNIMLKLQDVLESNIMLKLQDVLESNIKIKRMAIVKSTANKCSCNSFGNNKIHIPANTTKVTNVIKAATTSLHLIHSGNNS